MMGKPGKLRIKSSLRNRKRTETCGESRNVTNTEPSTVTLLNKAQDFIDTFNYEEAQKVLESVLEREPDNLEALESLSEVFTELSYPNDAFEVLRKILRTCPDPKYNIYFSIAQYHEGQESLEYYQKGIEKIQKLLANKTELKSDEIEEMNQSLSTAYCSMAEIYMTDLCDDDDADNRCKDYVHKSIENHPLNPEAYQLLADYMLIKESKEEAKLAIQKSLSLWLPKYKSLREAKSFSDPSELPLFPLSYQSRINASKVLIELDLFDEAFDVLEMLLDENDEKVETWFLLGWANYLKGEIYWGNARYYLKKAKEATKYDNFFDEDLIHQANEVLEKIGDESDEDNDDDDDDENEAVDEDINIGSDSDENVED